MKKLANVFWRIVFWNNPVGYVRKTGAKVGPGSLFMDHPKLGSEPYLITIGEQTNVSFGCSFVTHDGGRWVLDRLFPQYAPFARFGKIIVGNNCFIGCRSTLLPDVCIGDNCVIGAGSVVTRNVPSGEVWGGIPARFICKIEDYRERMHARKHNIDWKAYWQNKEKELLRVLGN